MQYYRLIPIVVKLRDISVQLAKLNAQASAGNDLLSLVTSKLNAEDDSVSKFRSEFENLRKALEKANIIFSEADSEFRKTVGHFGEHPTTDVHQFFGIFRGLIYCIQVCC